MIVEIIKIPAGPAPEWVRNAWLHVILAVLRFEPEDPHTDLIGKNREQIPYEKGYKVPAEMALEHLHRENQAAAQWYRDNIDSQLLSQMAFTFAEDECRLIMAE